LFRTRVPVNSRVHLVSNDRPYVSTPELAVMDVFADAVYRMNIKAGYGVNLRTTLNLAVNSTVLRGYVIAAKLTERQARINFMFHNRTNVNLRVKGLLAPEELVTGFDVLDKGIVSQQLLQDGVTSMGYINLLGSSGLYIPPRDSTSSQSVVLSDAQVDQWLRPRAPGRVFQTINIDSSVTPAVSDTTTDTLGTWESRSAFMWRVELEPRAMDALYDNDSLLISSSIYVEGVTSTDSLFSEWSDD
jgi:hypothetical protein